MSKRTSALCVAGAFTILMTGCTHQQLKYNTIKQSGTVTRIYEKQVLDNLAMFVVDNQAIPHFALPSAGSSNVTDSGAIAASPINRLQTIIGLQGSRGMQEAWTLDPVRDPAKLQRMRCAYQRAVGIINGECPDCCDLQAKWLGKELDKDKEPSAVQTDETDPKKYNCNDKCDITCGWFKSSRNYFDVPKDKCSVYGEYCGCYVWVCLEYRHEFAKLVFAILDYAANEPPSLNKTVVYKDKNSGFEQEVRVPAGTTENELRALLGLSPLADKPTINPKETTANQQKQRENILNWELERKRERERARSIIQQSKRPTPSRSSGILNLQQNLRNLAPN